MINIDLSTDSKAKAISASGRWLADLHGADEDGREDFDGVHAADQDFPVHLVGQFLLSAVHVLGHPGQPRGDVLGNKQEWMYCSKLMDRKN